jgi:hypothetical protein
LSFAFFLRAPIIQISTGEFLTTDRRTRKIVKLSHTHDTAHPGSAEK